ncbi:four helix bundle protein [Niabella beijingensis]|uniref:four helix bundle protein n=1 Tax=Niabella beijingensis TaxID=2872700 RepID=UPI001CBECF8A|nr:four helix bundle protein [Niabella beijingensis]MBZ4188839.1 four helix bundle protein [Niabella beijingensis]
MSSFDKEALKRRTKDFSIAVAKLAIDLPYNAINKNYGNQIIRSSSSTGANYRAACRAKSTADFINKLKIVEEETDETLYFLELLTEFNANKKEQIEIIWKEGNEILSIIVASIITLQGRKA